MGRDTGGLANEVFTTRLNNYKLKNHSNFIFRQFLVFVYDPIPKNENVEFAESFRKSHLLYQ